MENLSTGNNITFVSEQSSIEHIRERVFDQDCGAYLEHLGIEVTDGIGCNAPYRADSDSESFYTDGPLFYDHAGGEGGNVWQLAVLMNEGDHKAAAKSLYEAAGIPSGPNPQQSAMLDKRGKAEAALERVRQEFAIGETTPPEVIEYLEKRKITQKTWTKYLAYIPAGELAKVLTPAEIELTGLQYREEQIVLWYLQNGKPVYYCTRKIGEKAFRKASTNVLQHPIWNVDALYAEKRVVWAEGLFDCLSLIELGYAVAGEITCNLIQAHKPELLRALRWRQKHLPDSEFIICLDNDQPDSSGVGPGNEAAEKIAAWLWGEGIDEKWVKHDPTAQKVDANDLHQQSKQADIHKMIGSAQAFSEIFKTDTDQCQTNFLNCVAEGDLQTAKKMLEVIQTHEKKSGKEGLGSVAARCLQFRIPYQRVYRDIKLFLYGDSVYVFYPRGRYGDGQRTYDTYTRNTAVDNLHTFQRNAAMEVKWGMLDVPAKRPIWRVTRSPLHETKAEFNLFQPSLMLMQEPDSNADIPEQWELVLDNLAGEAEKEWLLNHMATYLQTLEKPRTIPVLVGRQGTGKNSLIELFGRGIGGYSAVGRGELESSFNSFLRSPVILLDELSSSNGDANSIKNKLKAVVNESILINEKYEKPVTVQLNNYIAIASNEQVTSVPVIVEDSDRRYTFITDGKDLNLAKVPPFNYEKMREQLPDFMLYLLSRPIDADRANIPLENQAKREFMLLGEDPVLAAYREWVASHRSDPETSVKVTYMMKDIRETYGLRGSMSAAKAAQILQKLGETVGRKGNQNHCFGVSGVENRGGNETAMGLKSPTGEKAVTDGLPPSSSRSSVPVPLKSRKNVVKNSPREPMTMQNRRKSPEMDLKPFLLE